MSGKVTPAGDFLGLVEKHGHLFRPQMLPVIRLSAGVIVAGREIDAGELADIFRR